MEIITKTSRYEVALEAGKQMLYQDGTLLGRFYHMDMAKIKVGQRAYLDYYKKNGNIEELWTLYTEEVMEVVK